MMWVMVHFILEVTVEKREADLDISDLFSMSVDSDALIPPIICDRNIITPIKEDKLAIEKDIFSRHPYKNSIMNVCLVLVIDTVISFVSMSHPEK